MRERLTREHGSEPRAVELADALGWSESRIHDVLRAERPGEQLDRIADGREASLADLLDDPLAADAYEDVLDRIALAQLRPLVLRLTERERQVLALRADGASLREVGRGLGVSGERVRALESRAVAKLRAGARSGVDTGQRLLTSQREDPDGVSQPPLPEEV
jgi:RNA polymerase sigma factor (sigma-70 family)